MCAATSSKPLRIGVDSAAVVNNASMLIEIAEKAAEGRNAVEKQNIRLPVPCLAGNCHEIRSFALVASELVSDFAKPLVDIVIFVIVLRNYISARLLGGTLAYTIVGIGLLKLCS